MPRTEKFPFNVATMAAKKRDSPSSSSNELLAVPEVAQGLTGLATAKPTRHSAIPASTQKAPRGAVPLSSRSKTKAVDEAASLDTARQPSETLQQLDTETTFNDLKTHITKKYGQIYFDRFNRELELSVDSKGYQALALLFQMMPLTEFDEICKGGQVRIPFDAKLFEELKAMGAESRRSSHYGNVIIPTAFQQVPGEHYGIDGDFFPTVLFGLLHDASANRLMYLQAERNSYNPSASLTEKLLHVLDSAAYAATHQNQGPYGVSNCTDASPLGTTDNPSAPWTTMLHPRRIRSISLQTLYVASWAAENGFAGLQRMVRLVAGCLPDTFFRRTPPAMLNDLQESAVHPGVGACSGVVTGPVPLKRSSAR